MSLSSCIRKARMQLHILTQVSNTDWNWICPLTFSISLCPALIDTPEATENTEVETSFFIYQATNEMPKVLVLQLADY